MAQPKSKQGQQKNKWDARRIFVAALALIMALLMLLPLLSNVVLYGYAITQADIDALKKQKSAIASQQSEAKKNLDELEKQENSAMERLNAIEEEIGLLCDQINATQDIIDNYSVLIAQTQDELAQAQADEDVYYQRFLDRVRAMEEEGTVSYWEILFQASSFSDLLDRFSFVNDVMKYDNDMMDNLEAARLAVAEAENKLKEEQAQQQEAQAQLEQERTEQEAAAEQEQAVLDEILANEELYSDKIQALSVQQEQLVGQITAAEQQYAEEQARKALEEQRRREEEERKRQEEAARQAAIKRQQEEAERKRQEEEAERQRQEQAQQQETENDTEIDTEPDLDLDTEPVDQNDTDLDLDLDPDPEPDPEPVVETPKETGKNPSGSVSGSTIIGIASQYVGNRYVWGGNSLSNGIDCSGFVHAVLSQCGVSSPRQSASFRSFGKAVSVENMQVGDVVCYSGHVGFYAGGGQLLSALGKNYGITYCSVNYKPILAVRRA